MLLGQKKNFIDMEIKIFIQIHNKNHIKSNSKKILNEMVHQPPDRNSYDCRISLFAMEVLKKFFVQNVNNSTGGWFLFQKLNNLMEYGFPTQNLNNLMENSLIRRTAIKIHSKVWHQLRGQAAFLSCIVNLKGSILLLPLGCQLF